MAKTYYEKLKDPKWQKMRLLVLERDKWSCSICKSKTDTLNVHHKKYAKSGNPWDVSMHDLITYCEDCHKLVEENKIKWMRLFHLITIPDGSIVKINDEDDVDFFDVIEFVCINEKLLKSAALFYSFHSDMSFESYAQGIRDGERSAYKECEENAK